MTRDYSEWVSPQSPWRDLLMPDTIGRLEFIGRYLGLLIVTLLLGMIVTAMMGSDHRVEQSQHMQALMEDAHSNTMAVLRARHPDFNISANGNLEVYADMLAEQRKLLSAEHDLSPNTVDLMQYIVAVVLAVLCVIGQIFIAMIPRARDLGLPWPRLSVLFAFVPLFGSVYLLILASMPRGWYKERFSV